MGERGGVRMNWRNTYSGGRIAWCLNCGSFVRYCLETEFSNDPGHIWLSVPEGYLIMADDE